MTFETKNERNDETTDVWETLLARRLADDLDAFLETASDETFLFAEETNAPRRVKRNGKTPRFKKLATVAASLTVLCGVASTKLFYVASPTANVVETPPENDETSLLAWGVETLGESEWPRRLETRLISADVFGIYAASETESEAAKEASAERFAVAEVKAGGSQSGAAETESSEWLSLETLSDVAEMEPLKYEPFIQAVAASLR